MRTVLAVLGVLAYACALSSEALRLPAAIIGTIAFVVAVQVSSYRDGFKAGEQAGRESAERRATRDALRHDYVLYGVRSKPQTLAQKIPL